MSSELKSCKNRLSLNAKTVQISWHVQGYEGLVVISYILCENPNRQILIGGIKIRYANEPYEWKTLCICMSPVCSLLNHFRAESIPTVHRAIIFKALIHEVTKRSNISCANRTNIYIYIYIYYIYNITYSCVCVCDIWNPERPLDTFSILFIQLLLFSFEFHWYVVPKIQLTTSQ